MNRPTLMLISTLLLAPGACDLEDALDLERDGALLDAASDAEGTRPLPPPPELLLQAAIEVGALDLDDEMQAALDQRHEAHEAARDAHEALRRAQAEAVAAGSVDVQAFGDAIASLEEAARREGVALELALDTAHARLDEAERAEVVDMLPPPPDGDRQGPPPPGPRPEGSEGPGGPEGMGPPPGPGMLLEALGLDESQRRALAESLGEPTPPQRPTPPDLETFADEEFSAAELGLATQVQQRTREQAEHEVELLAALVPLLDDSQRATLEQLLSEPPPAPEGPRREPS